MIDDTNATLCRNIKYSSELVGGGGVLSSPMKF